MAWALWSNRNEILYGGEGKTGPAIALWIEHFLQEYWSATGSSFQATPDSVQHIPDAQHQPMLVAWLPPSAGDSLIISNALKRHTIPPSSVDAIMEGIHELGTELGVVHFSHVHRIGNKPAHILARQAQNLVNDVIWIEKIPCCIQHALIQDVSVL
nr:hypothetical protein CFP56_48012 [Quercus suber]